MSSRKPAITTVRRRWRNEAPEHRPLGERFPDRGLPTDEPLQPDGPLPRSSRTLPSHMSELVSYVKRINSELEDAIGALNQEDFNSFLDAIATASTIALHGVGREGLMMRAFAMRLFHLGYNVSVVGDMTAPHLGAGDLLILSAGPGYFSTVDGLRAVAQRDGAKVFCLTAQRDGRTPQACDGVLLIPAQTMADDRSAKPSSICQWEVYTS